MTVSLLHSVPADGSFSAAGAAAWDAQHVLTQATNRLLGRTTAGVGATEEISVGSGLSLSGGTLINAGATSPIGGSDTQVQFNDGGVFAGNANFTFNKTTNQIAIGAGTTAAPTLIPTGDTNTGMWFPAADTIAWSTGGTERLRISSAGVISVANGAGTLSDTQIYWASAVAFQPQINLVNSNNGTTGPIWTTDKSRGGTTPANSGDQLGQFLFRSYNSSGVFSNAAQMQAISAGVTATGHAGAIRWVTRNTSDVFAERMRIDGAGNLGINTTIPDALLTVNGVASFGAGTAALPSVAKVSDLDTGMWFPAANTLAWSTGGSERFRIDSSGNVGIGTSSFGTSAATALAIATGTAPTTGPADTIQIYSTDLSAGNTMLSLYTEGTVVNANVVAATTHRIAIRVNGTVYYLLANTAA